MKIIYNNESKETGIHEMEVEKLNGFGGADISHLQVLKSAAGYYIGELCAPYWMPYMRDSDCYWATREEAENALRSENYPVKFWL